jgi:hypothetical protein
MELHFEMPLFKMELSGLNPECGSTMRFAAQQGRLPGRQSGMRDSKTESNAAIRHAGRHPPMLRRKEVCRSACGKAVGQKKMTSGNSECRVSIRIEALY